MLIINGKKAFGLTAPSAEQAGGRSLKENDVESQEILGQVDAHMKKLECMGIYPKQHEELVRAESQEEVLEHCHYMLYMITSFLYQKRVREAYEWFGFAQGCLFAEGVYTLEELNYLAPPPEAPIEFGEGLETPHGDDPNLSMELLNAHSDVRDANVAP